MGNAAILVVEDEKLVAEDIRDCLQRLGYAVVGTAGYGTEALRKAVETEPDLVLMDIKLKGSVDGIQAAEQLYRRLNIPVVYLTAYADLEILERAKKTSPSGYVVKPFDERSLRSAIEIALHRHRIERQLLEDERWLAAAVHSIDEAVILTEARGRVTLVSHAAEALTGWPKEKALGKHIADLFVTIDSETGAMLKSPVERVTIEDRKISLGAGMLLLNRNGTKTPIEGTAAPIRDENAKLAGVAVIFQAITPQC
jgi:two-component system cell cycle sensor histidine kinase/response regulator CckA